MLALQNLASEGGFWIFIAAISVVLVTAGYVFQRPAEGRPTNYRKRMGRAANFWLCVVIAVTVWWLFASMIGAR